MVVGFPPQGGTRAFSDNGYPGTRCCSCSLFLPGVHRPGEIFINVRGIIELVPACQNDRYDRKVCTGDGWEPRVVNRWLDNSSRGAAPLLNTSKAHHPSIGTHPRRIVCKKKKPSSRQSNNQFESKGHHNHSSGDAAGAWLP